MIPKLPSSDTGHQIITTPFLKLFPQAAENVEDVANNIDPFNVNFTTGFLPTKRPIVNLHPLFKPVQDLVEAMPVKRLDGSPGLLATYSLGRLIVDGGHLADLTQHIDTLKVPGTDKLDLHMITALFRDYSFLASAYLLEPCWKTWNERKKGNKDQQPSSISSEDSNNGTAPSTANSGSLEYGLGRSTLPACIARPLVRCAEILNIPPFMSYAASYALYNYYTVDTTSTSIKNDQRDHTALPEQKYDSIRLIRAFHHGLNTFSSEAGFIQTHIHMVSYTGPLIRSVVSTLDAIASSDIPVIKTSLSSIVTTMSAIEASMHTMWTQSKPADYPAYRTFIFGITSQPLFPDGVVYEGCFENKPQFYRGESGANDSIIPLLDNLCQVPMPVNPLTKILREFRGYRPSGQRAVLEWAESMAKEIEAGSFLASGGCNKTDRDLEVVVLYLRVLNHIRSFRWRHWQFAREYIIKQSKYPVATGGSPIVTWLPNQLFAVVQLMENVYVRSGLRDAMDSGAEPHVLAKGDLEIVKGIMEEVDAQKVKLEKEVRKYCTERGQDGL